MYWRPAICACAKNYVTKGILKISYGINRYSHGMAHFTAITLLLPFPQRVHSLVQSRHNWAPSSEFVSSSIPSWQIVTAHAQPFRGARDLAFCLKVPLDSLLVWASSEGSGETARMRRLVWTFAARIGDKYQIRLTRSNYKRLSATEMWTHSASFLQEHNTTLLCRKSRIYVLYLHI